MMSKSEYRDMLISQSLREIETANGRLTPDEVIQVAKDPTHILHGQFDWDDTIAAGKWRLEQARRLIRSVHIEYHEEKSVVRSVAYVKDPESEDEQGYVSTQQLQKEPENARKMLIREFKRAESYIRRTEHLAVAVGMGKEVSSAIRKLRSVTAKAEELELEHA